ncbi:MAG: class I SAM-dependent methyltransferase [Pseudomonadota bacterium]|nr:class I SAM-dependent methyltransferase [Pseudomonadota bacterium]
MPFAVQAHDTTDSFDANPGMISDLEIARSPWSADIAPEAAAQLLSDAYRSAAAQPDFKTILQFKKKSMLHAEVLIFLRYLAAITIGPILELGAYFGGSTTMLAKGVREPGKLIALEPGGSFLTHPDIPSENIYADLEQTLQDHKVRDRVTLLKMASWEEGSKREITEQLQGQEIALLCIDSDGHVGRDIELYRPLCAPGCILVVDDFVTSGVDVCHKSDHVKPYIIDALANRSLVEFGVYGWGTWFGRLA